MNFKKFLFGAFSLLMLSACSNEDSPASPDNGKDGDLYASIKIQLPTDGSRSQTTTPDGEGNNSTEGSEIGQDYENTIASLTVVLATYDEESKTYTKKASSIQSSTFDTSHTGNTYTIQFQNKDILALAEQTVYFFAYCNEDESKENYESLGVLGEKVTTITSADKETGIWTPKKFFMTNAFNKGVPSVKFPKEEVLLTYNSPENAFKLGTVNVSRVCSRFDFRETVDNTYDIVDLNAPEDDNEPMAKIKLLAMAPVNIAKEFYRLPRVSADGTATDWEICGTETPNNWVVSPNFAMVKAAADANTAPSAELMAKYFYPTANSNVAGVNFWETDLKYDNLDFEGVNLGNGDNWTLPEESKVNKSGYKIWRYVTENTIPAVSAQKTGISTGIVFRGEITAPKAGTPFADAFNAKKVIYNFNGVMYGDVNALRETAAAQQTDTRLKKAFVAIWGEDALKKNADGTFVNKEIRDCTSAENGALAVGNRFKILRPTDGSYKLYYVYRNRHNDNNNIYEMGAMEFGTVRNNIYKLSVTSISRFGHTADPGDDDDPEDPNDPDEDPKVYFNIACHLVPWTVRVNSIEF